MIYMSPFNMVTLTDNQLYWATRSGWSSVRIAALTEMARREKAL